MYIPGHVVLEFSAEQIESMRDSVFGYNDELAYAILDESTNAGQFVLGHIENFNFSGGLRLYNDYFHHEFAHLLLGLSFLKRGQNPYPFEYGYDGNYMAEEPVLAAQEFFTTIYLDAMELDKEKFVTGVTTHYAHNSEFVDMKNSIQAVEIMMHDPSLTRVFDARRKLHCDNDEMIQRNDVPLLIMKCTESEYGDQLYLGKNLPRHAVEQFFDDIQPIIRFVHRNFKRLIDDSNVDVEHNPYALRDYLKTIPVHALWDVMNNPELAETMDLDHRETLTWEFCGEHEGDTKILFNRLGIRTGDLIKAKHTKLQKPYDASVKIGDRLDYYTGVANEVLKKAERQILPFGQNQSGLDSQIQWEQWKKDFGKTILSCLIQRGIESLPAAIVMASTSLPKRETTPTPSM